MKRVRLLALFLLVAFGGYFLGKLTTNSNFIGQLLPADGLPAYAIVSMVLVIPLAIAIHELGHLLTGLAVGFRFELLVVGPFGIRRTESGSIRPYFNTDINQYGGLAATSPRTYDEGVADKLAAVLLAGPIASLLLMLAAVLLIFVAPQPFGIVLLFLALVSFALFAATTLPSRTGIFYTDRKRYQRLSQPGKSREIELALFKTIAAQSTGQQMNLHDLELITEDESKVFQYMGYFYLCQYHRNDQLAFCNARDKMQALEPALPNSLVMYFNKEIDKLQNRHTSP